MTKSGTPVSDSRPPAGDRRARTRAVIAKLLAERNEMLVLYCRVAGLAPYDSGPRTDELHEQFCEVLIDYMAAGHFGLYERITEGNERRREVAKVAKRVYPRIADTTQNAVDYNDMHDGKPFRASESLDSDLSRLGEEIAVRIALEDKLIAALLR